MEKCSTADLSVGFGACGDCCCKKKLRRRQQTTYNVAVARPCHHIPFDCDVCIRIQRIKCDDCNGKTTKEIVSEWRRERERERSKGSAMEQCKIGSECLQREDRELLFFSGGDRYYNTRRTRRDWEISNSHRPKCCVKCC